MKSTKYLTGCLLSGLIATVLAGVALAQSTAAIVGTVRDASGAAVVGARVTVTNVNTGLSQTRASGTEGTYSLPLLPVGSYRLEAESPGFQRYVREGITLAVNDTATIDVILNVGAVTEEVTVTAAAPLLETQTGTIRGVVDQQRIVNLPLNGRNITQLMAIQAGVISRGGSYGEGDAFVVNGSRQNGVYYLMDSGMNTDSYRNYSGNFPNPDAIQEFSVQKSNFSAEYANATGAVVNVVTKSGTNQFHGSVFHFVRNGVFNARNFFAARRDSLKRNQFGATFGGPVQKDKLFFFVSYQGTRLRSDPGLTRQFLPTAAMRKGDFSAISKAIIDPTTKKPFANNQIPLDRFNPVTVNFLKYLPDPGTPNGQRFIGVPIKNDLNEFTAKADYLLGNHRFTGRYFRNKFTRPFGGNVEDYASMYTSSAGLSTQPYSQWTFSDLYTFSPSLINSATFAYRSRRTFNDWTAVKLPMSFADAGVKGIAVNDPVSLYIGVSGYFTARPGWVYDKPDTDVHIYDAVTYIRGRHEVKFGGEYLRSTNTIRNHYRTMGNFDFNGSISGNSMADFMLGEVYRLWQGGGEYKDLSGNRFGLFAQDNIRATPDLTFNLGFRWDPVYPFSDSLGRVQCFRPGVQSTRFPNAPEGYLNAGDPQCPEGGFDNFAGTVAPRLGVAWRPASGKTVLRGGYGFFWNPQFTVLYNGFVNSAPFSPQVTLFGVKFDNPYANYPNPFPKYFAPFDPPKDSEFFLPLGQFGSFAPDFQPSYMQTYNLTIEREVMSSLVGRVSYIGNLGRQLSYDQDVNYARYIPGNSSTKNIQQRRPYQNFGTILIANSGSTSSYHALQVSVERRVADNFSFEWNYTFSKTIDEYSSDPTPGQSSSLAIPYSRKANRGRADFDIPHRMILSYVWALPRLSTSSALVRHVLGGWETSGIWSLQSGSPFTVRSGVDRAYSGINLDYADLVGDPFLDTGRPREELIARYFNTSAFSLAGVGTFGTAPRNLMRGPGDINLDLGMMKNFPLQENLQLQFRAEFFNALNRPNFGSPYASANNASRFGKIESAGDPRIVQFALKLSF